MQTPRPITMPLLALSAFLGAAAPAQQTFYVSTNCGDDAWSGLSADCQAPDGPKRTIQAAIDATAVSGDTVLVAPGEYSGPGNVGLKIYARQVTLRGADGPFSTIVEGADAETWWLSHSSNIAGTVIDGFTVRNFQLPNGLAAINTGAGLGGDVTILNCRFLDNICERGGGIFIDEEAEGDHYIYNCVFARNSGSWAGAIRARNLQGGLVVAGCTFSENHGGLATDVISFSAAAELSNCAFRGDGPHLASGPAVPLSYSNIEGEWGDGISDGGGNIDADPLFADPANDDYRLLPGSPCIDAADNTAVPGWLAADIAGLPRFADDPLTEDTGVGTPPVVDMGAHEYQPAACYADFTGDGTLDLFDFLAFVNAFNAADPAADCDHSGSLDLFDFLCFTNTFNEGC